jgi:glutamate N-acetyltransferase/amino-acid N-acetyltransferase
LHCPPPPSRALFNSHSAVITGPGHADFPALTAALAECCTDLARLLAYDGEGATKLITVHASGSASRADAHLLAQTVAASQLVKTAVHGGDANWGRILCAAGYSGAPLDPARVSCAMAAEGVGRVELLAAGEPVDIDETLATQIVAAGEVEVHFDAGLGGDGRATVWASDLTHGYIDINGSYRS